MRKVEKKKKEEAAWLKTEQKCTAAEQQCHTSISLQRSMNQPDTHRQPYCPATCPAIGPCCIG